MSSATPFGFGEQSSQSNQNLAMSISQNIPANSNFTDSLIAIGNPIVDITTEITSETIHRLGLEWGRTVFANEKNIDFYKELEKRPEVTYTPGGSIQNTLRVASWCLRMDENNKDKFKITMLGCVGEDLYKDKIVNSLKDSGVYPLLQIMPNMQTSRCGVGIYKKERCLLTEIRASNKLSEDFVEQHKEEIYSHKALLLEGYFVQDKYNLCKTLCENFDKDNKIIILTLSAVFMVQNFKDKMIELANKSTLIIGNIEEAEELAGGKGANFQETFTKIHSKLSPKDRTLVITCGSSGVLCSKYNYEANQLEFILQYFPIMVKNEEIVDLNGAGDSFLGGFIANYLRGKDLNSCSKLGNNAAGVILRNVGCTFNKNLKLKLD